MLKRRVSVGTEIAGAILVLWFSRCIAPAQDAPNATPTPTARAVKLVEGTDAGSGVHYLRFSVTADPAGDAAQEPARLTMECREKNGKHDLFWYVSFGGVPEQSFEPPFHATKSELFPPRLPREKLTMVFEGYMSSKPFTRTWVVENSGELRYCNSGLDCPNMESPIQFIPFLNALPGLRIRAAKSTESKSKETFFATRPILDAMKANPVCGL